METMCVPERLLLSLTDVSHNGWLIHFNFMFLHKILYYKSVLIDDFASLLTMFCIYLFYVYGI